MQPKGKRGAESCQETFGALQVLCEARAYCSQFGVAQDNRRCVPSPIWAPTPAVGLSVYEGGVGVWPPYPHRIRSDRMPSVEKAVPVRPTGKRFLGHSAHVAATFTESHTTTNESGWRSQGRMVLTSRTNSLRQTQPLDYIRLTTTIPPPRPPPLVQRPVLWCRLIRGWSFDSLDPFDPLLRVLRRF